MMPYAQKDYPNIAQGIPPTRYTIAEIGCFITSFCNLLRRLGHDVSPPALNAALSAHRAYIDVDDGVRDDVAWDTITQYDPKLKVAAVGTSARPPTNNCIVKFVYGGGKTHFCLVKDHKAKTVIDSWDGKVKPYGFYGGVKAWASYVYNDGIGVPASGGQDMYKGESAEHWYKKYRREQKVDKPVLQVLYRLYLGRGLSDYGKKHRLGKETPAEVQRGLLASSAFKDLAGQAKSGELNPADHLPKALRDVYKARQADTSEATLIGKALIAVVAKFGYKKGV